MNFLFILLISWLCKVLEEPVLKGEVGILGEPCLLDCLALGLNVELQAGLV